MNNAANAKTYSEQPVSTYAAQKASTNEQAYFLNTISTLFHLGKSVTSTNITKVISNVHYMAFALAWFGLVSLTYPPFNFLLTCCCSSRVNLTSLRQGKR